MAEPRYCNDMVSLARGVRDGVYGPAGDEHLLALHLDTCRQCRRAYRRDQRADARGLKRGPPRLRDAPSAGIARRGPEARPGAKESPAVLVPAGLCEAGAEANLRSIRPHAEEETEP